MWPDTAVVIFSLQVQSLAEMLRLWTRHVISLSAPRMRTSFGYRHFAAAGPGVWNGLLTNLQKMTNQIWIIQATMDFLNFPDTENFTKNPGLSRRHGNPDNSF